MTKRAISEFAYIKPHNCKLFDVAFKWYHCFVEESFGKYNVIVKQTILAETSSNDFIRDLEIWRVVPIGVKLKKEAVMMRVIK